MYAFQHVGKDIHVERDDEDEHQDVAQHCHNKYDKLVGEQFGDLSETEPGDNNVGEEEAGREDERDSLCCRLLDEVLQDLSALNDPLCLAGNHINLGQDYVLDLRVVLGEVLSRLRQSLPGCLHLRVDLLQPCEHEALNLQRGHATIADQELDRVQVGSDPLVCVDVNGVYDDEEEVHPYVQTEEQSQLASSDCGDLRFLLV